MYIPIYDYIRIRKANIISRTLLYEKVFFQVKLINTFLDIII